MPSEFYEEITPNEADGITASDVVVMKATREEGTQVAVTYYNRFGSGFSHALSGVPQIMTREEFWERLCKFMNWYQDDYDEG